MSVKIVNTETHSGSYKVGIRQTGTPGFMQLLTKMPKGGPLAFYDFCSKCAASRWICLTVTGTAEKKMQIK